MGESEVQRALQKVCAALDADGIPYAGNRSRGWLRPRPGMPPGDVAVGGGANDERDLVVGAAA